MVTSARTWHCCVKGYYGASQIARPHNPPIRKWYADAIVLVVIVVSHFYRNCRCGGDDWGLLCNFAEKTIDTIVFIVTIDSCLRE